MKQSKAILVIGLSSLAYVICVLQRLSPPIIALDISQGLGLNQSQMSFIFVLTFIGYAVMQPLAGFLVDRFGPRRCLLLSTLLMGLSSIWFSMAGSMTSACLSRALLGLSGGMAFLPGLRLVMNWFPARYFGLATSALLAASALANFMAGSPLARIVAAHDWRFPFFWLGLGTFGLFALIWGLVSDHPKGAEAETDGEMLRLSFFPTASLIVRNPMYWLLGGLYIGTDLLYLTFTSFWAGPYLVQAHGLDMVTVGDILSVAAISFLIGPPLLALWGDRWGSYAKVLLCIVLFNAAFIAFMIWGPANLSLWVLYPLCFLAPVGGQAAPLLMALFKDCFPRNIATSAIGFLNMVPMVGCSCLQQLLGWLLTRTEHDPLVTSAHQAYGEAWLPALLWAVVTIGLALAVVRIWNRREAV